jgi:hypothetical protein
LSGSDCRSKQAPLHEVSPVGHVATHWPLSQDWPEGHARLQAPQLAGSLPRRTQRLLQLVVPLGHWQRELRQVPPLPQTLPQAPQLFASPWVKVQVPLQSVCPGKQVAWQLKPVHTWPAWQTTLQAPQLLGSVRETQRLLQRIVPAGHWQTPLVQVPPPQVLPQVPQFDGSVAVLAHSPLHTW